MLGGWIDWGVGAGGGVGSTGDRVRGRFGSCSRRGARERADTAFVLHTLEGCNVSFGYEWCVSAMLSGHCVEVNASHARCGGKPSALFVRWRDSRARGMELGGG